MFVDLPKEFKGTHMSRFVEVLNAHGNIIHVENISGILLELQKKLNAATSIWKSSSRISCPRNRRCRGWKV